MTEPLPSAATDPQGYAVWLAAFNDRTTRSWAADVPVTLVTDVDMPSKWKKHIPWSMRPIRNRDKPK